VHTAHAIQEHPQANPARAGVLQRLQFAHPYLRLELVPLAKDNLGIGSARAARLIDYLGCARN
jgi:hypothetical protein